MPKSPVFGTECLPGDPRLEEEFRRLKKRDLTETYLFQLACGSLGPQECSGGDLRKPMMDKIKTSTRPQPKQLDAQPAIPASARRGAAEFYSRLPGGKPAEHPDWIRDRKAFREALESMGDLRRWLHNKPILTDSEFLVMERDRQAQRMSSLPPETSIAPSAPDAITSSRELRREVEEVNSFLRMCEPCNLFKLLDWNETGQLKRVDLCNQFKKEGFFIQPERLNVLMSSLNSKDGNSVTVEDLAAGIQAWSRKHQENEEQQSNPGYWNADCEKRIGSRHYLPIHGGEKDDQKGMQDVEVLAIMRRVLAASKTSCPSSLGGPMGREVDRFRRLCFREYLKSLEQCQRQALNVSQATLQKVLLHPGDMSMSSIFKLGGKGHFGTPKTHQAEGGTNKGHKEMKKQPVCWADPNAFWPGREDHVRLFLPVKTSSPAMVLFQRIETTVLPSPGHWPVNHLGYSTSGDIEARKTYTL
ncbi:EF-hand calcium-binding domain-containing protein 12 [Carassius auratus]|uniref:EF-hand calcium-binding domain-containing protein 12 n=1 Tax=Carassius auratus TaxID=7957 RepID=A0A6P6KD83_CARAU|nr:EF-hand calcium-binding domain-containing protein 12 [Carassius auratus]